MRIIIGEHAGFCFGVKRADETAFACAQEKLNAVTLGPLIHNPQEVERLCRAGIPSVESMDEVGDGQTMIIRSHGVAPSVYEQARARGLSVIDATCPHVARIHDLVARYSEQGDTVIIVGEADHPEVRGIAGWAKGPVLMIPDAETAASIPVPDRALVIAQTTLREESFQRVLEVLEPRIREMTVRKTICGATEHRQEEARQLARTADVMVIVGGKNSSNTTKLAETCRSLCRRSYLAEVPEDLRGEMFRNAVTVGVTAGASTPQWLLDQVVDRIRSIDEGVDSER